MNLANVPSPSQARGDFLNAITCGPPGRVPCCESHFSRKHMADLLGNHVLGEYPTGPIPALRTPPEWSFEIACKLGIGFVTTSSIWELGRIYDTNEQGEFVYVGGSLRTIDDLRSADRPPFEPILQRLERFVSLGRRYGQAVGFGVYSPFTIGQLAMGVDHLCLALYDDIDLVMAILDAAVGFYVPLIESALDIGMDFLQVSEAICFGTGSICNPDLTRRLWRPGMEAYLEPVRRRGIPIGFHSDGDNTVFVEDFISVGAAYLHPIEPCSDRFDIYKTQEKVAGRLALCGNIDLAGVLSRGTPREVRQDVGEHIRRLGPAGGYLCGSSHEISDSVPPENFEAMVQAIHDFGARYSGPAQ